MADQRMDANQHMAIVAAILAVGAAASRKDTLGPEDIVMLYRLTLSELKEKTNFTLPEDQPAPARPGLHLSYPFSGSTPPSRS